MGRKEGEEKVGQDRLIGGAGDSKNAVSGKSDASTMCFGFLAYMQESKAFSVHVYS